MYVSMCLSLVKKAIKICTNNAKRTVAFKYARQSVTTLVACQHWTTACRHALWAGGRHNETAVGIIAYSLDDEKIA